MPNRSAVNGFGFGWGRGRPGGPGRPPGPGRGPWNPRPPGPPPGPWYPRPPMPRPPMPRPGPWYPPPPIPGPGPGYPPGLKNGLISVLQNEYPRNPAWGYGDRQEALNALYSYPYDISPSQDRELRAIYRGQEYGTVSDFIRVLYQR